MRTLIAAIAATFTFSAHAQAVYTDGVNSIELRTSVCSSEYATAVLQFMDAKSEPKRADVMLAGVFVPACWAEDEDGDILLADTKGGADVLYRSAFEGLLPKGSGV
jgi:hypothetical protein